MNIYIDESGSINRNLPAKKDFVIALVHPLDKDRLKTVHKRFVSTNYLRLQELDQSADGGKMFLNGDFRELKGSQFDPEMKHKFVDFFTRKKHFELFYIHIHNDRLNERFCSNTARAFNYALKLSLQYFIKWGYLPDEDCFLQIDERNERTGTRHFLESYLNTELSTPGLVNGEFAVQYFDSANNRGIQIADVFSNLYYSNLMTGNYEDDLSSLRSKGILKRVFHFPLESESA